MKEFIKNNIKILLAVGVTAIICISGTVFAAEMKFKASEISYKDDKNVEQALNNLYDRINGPTRIVESERIVKSTEGNSVTISNMDNDSYYICFLYFRNDVSGYSATNAETLFHYYNGSFLDFKYATHVAYLHTLDTSITITIPGARGMYCQCYKVR